CLTSPPNSSARMRNRRPPPPTAAPPAVRPRRSSTFGLSSRPSHSMTPAPHSGSPMDGRRHAGTAPACQEHVEQSISRAGRGTDSLSVCQSGLRRTWGTFRQGDDELGELAFLGLQADLSAVQPYHNVVTD